MSEPELFNYAMAKWAVVGEPDAVLFQRLIDNKQRNVKDTRTPNYAQCLSVAYWVVHDTAAAQEWLDRARSLIIWRRSPEFSCWRYRRVSPDTFLSDVSEIGELLQGKRTVPRFFGDRSETLKAER